MKLKNAAKYFDTDSVYDAYSGDYLFKAQFSTFEGASPDGSFHRRRTVSVAPEVVAAPRRVVTVQGTTWIMGELIAEGFRDKPIRKSSSAKEVTGLYDLLTPGQAALREPTGIKQLYGHANYLKDTVNSLTDSAYDPQYEVTFAFPEVIQAGNFLRSLEHFLHIRTVQFANEGYWIATADEIAAAPTQNSCEVAVVLSGTFNPVTESYGVGTSTTGILLDMYKLYNFNTQADPRNQAGDMSLLVAKTAITPLAGQTLEVAGEEWRNIKFTSYHDAWNIQIRRS